MIPRQSPSPSDIPEWDPWEQHTCGDCGVAEGCLHEPGCDQEKCPFCLWQLITCGCRYRMFYPEYDDGLAEDPAAPGGWRPRHPTHGLPEEVYCNGLPDEQRKKWQEALDAKGRVPFVVAPNLCARCGQRWPAMFMVEDWHRIIPANLHAKMLCRACYEAVKSFVLEALAEEKGGAS